MASMADTRAEGFFRSESTRGTTPPPPPSHPQNKEDKPQSAQPQSQQGEPQSRLPGIMQTGDKIVANSTNYSVTFGPAWIEFTNPAAQAAGSVVGHIPLWGSGQMLAALKLPLGCVVIKPTVTPALLQQMTAAQKQQQQQKQQQEKEQKEKEQKEKKEKEQKEKEQKQGAQGAQPFAGSGTLQPQHAGMGAETQARHNVDDDLRMQYQGEIGDEITAIHGDQPRALTPDEQALTGMSPSGFPGLLPGLQASALPSGMGVQGVAIDGAQSPAQITVTLVGAGSIPAHSRWLIFTIQGV